MIDRTHDLPVTRQCQILKLARSTAYYTPQPVSDSDLKLMRRIDKLHLEYPFAGSRMLRDMLRQEGHQIGRKHVRTLMKKMGIEALYRKPNTSQRHAAHPVYPYLLRDLKIDRSNQVWATDITYIPMAPWWWSSPSASRGALRVSRLSARAADDGKKSWTKRRLRASSRSEEGLDTTKPCGEGSRALPSAVYHRARSLPSPTVPYLDLTLGIIVLQIDSEHSSLHENTLIEPLRERQAHPFALASRLVNQVLPGF